MMVEGLLSIQSGVSTIAINQKLSVFLTPQERQVRVVGVVEHPHNLRHKEVVGFQNVLLLRLARGELAAHGFRVLSHRLVPPNDGGLALGQIAVAGRRAGPIAAATGRGAEVT